MTNKSNAQLSNHPTIPDGYLGIPIHPTDNSPLTLCVLVRKTPDPVGGSFVLLRSTIDGRVYLGCIRDTDGFVREWIELWIQDIEGIEKSYPSYKTHFNNYLVDKRWSELARLLASLDRNSFVKTGWEDQHPLLTSLDTNLGEPKYLTSVDPESSWALCKDDALLQSVGLSPYTTSLHRYVYQPSLGTKSKFIPVVSSAPKNDATVTLESVLKKKPESILFNPQCGLVLTTSFSPLGYEDYVDLLGGKSWKGFEHGMKPFNLGGIYRTLKDWNDVQQSDAHFFMGPHGRIGRFLEVFHLKLILLVNAFRAVHAHVNQYQHPFLNLSARSFGVRFVDIAECLPYFWSTKLALIQPSQACEVPMEGTDLKCFLSPNWSENSIYCAPNSNLLIKGTGTIRIRKVLPSEQGTTVMEGTLVTQEKIDPSPNSLFWIQLPLSNESAQLYAHLSSDESMAKGELRFRTVPQQFRSTAEKAMKSIEGASISQVPFEFVPLLSTPVDLYALGVVAVRTLLVNHENTLPIALDEIHSLASRISEEHNVEIPLWQRIQSIFEKDPRWKSSLGPHRLTRLEINQDEAWHWISPGLWWQTLATLVRMFPKMGPDSTCHDFDDVQPLALESVFDEPLKDLEQLIIRSRSLILIDWNFNREIHSVIRDFVNRNKDWAM